MKTIRSILFLTLILGITAIIGFGGTAADVPTSSKTASAIETNYATIGRASPATATLYYNEETANIDGIVTDNANIASTSPADLYFNYANLPVTTNDGLIGAHNKTLFMIGSASYRQVNISRYPVSPTTTDMPAALSVSNFTYTNAVLVTVGRKELASSSFL